MNKNNYSPYGTFSLEKIDAPKKTAKSDPRAKKTSGAADIRGGKKNARA